jgi:type II secretory ATPase GspE/PulE/Tfp pilus assembly ATPase PilB-like protein
MTEQDTKKKKEAVQLPPITFIPSGSDDDERQASLDLVTPSPGFPTMAFLITDAVIKRAEIVMLDLTRMKVVIRFQIDGMWHTMPEIDRQNGDFLFATLKQVAGLDIRERRMRQAGKFSVNYNFRDYPCRIVTQGVKTGERVAIYIEQEKPKLDSVEELGMRPRMVEQLKKLVRSNQGMFIVSGLPSGGLTTTWRAVLSKADLFTRDIFSIEEKNRVEPETVNVNLITFDESAGENILSPIRQAMLQEPDGFCFTEIPDGDTLDQFSKFVNVDSLFVITRNHGHSCIDSLLRLLSLNPNRKNLADALLGVLNVRLLRKLCKHCRREFEPNPQFLQRLGIPEGRIARLYTQYKPLPEEMVDEKGKPIQLMPCPSCQGLGFNGRLAIFELLTIDDAMRTAITENPTAEGLTNAARGSGHLFQRDEGMVPVAKGETSIEELQRILTPPKKN